MSDAMGLMNIVVSSSYMLVLRLIELALMGLRSPVCVAKSRSF
jgi:hypothetical protein